MGASHLVSKHQVHQIDWRENMKRLSFFITVFAILLLPAAVVHADEPVPVADYIVEVGDGRYVFVMLVGESDVVSEIRAKYEKSGLYEADETENALWTVDWYASEVDITPDGKHLVRWGPWPSVEDYDELALEFHENGVLLRSYRVSDLVAVPQKLPRTVSHLSWKAESEFNAEERELYLRTENDEEYRFDVTTGDVIEERGPINVPLCPMIGGIVVLGPAGGLLIRKRSKAS
jgi:hypothetical protein